MSDIGMKESEVYHLVPESGIGGAGVGIARWSESLEDDAIGKRSPCPEGDTDVDAKGGGCT